MKLSILSLTVITWLVSSQSVAAKTRIKGLARRTTNENDDLAETGTLRRLSKSKSKSSSDSWEECYPTTLERINAVSFFLTEFWSELVEEGCPPTLTKEIDKIYDDYFDQQATAEGEEQGDLFSDLDGIKSIYAPVVSDQCRTKTTSWVGANFEINVDGDPTVGKWSGDEIVTSNFGMPTDIENLGRMYKLKLTEGCEFKIMSLKILQQGDGMFSDRGLFGCSVNTMQY